MSWSGGSPGRSCPSCRSCPTGRACRCWPTRPPHGAATPATAPAAAGSARCPPTPPPPRASPSASSRPSSPPAAPGGQPEAVRCRLITTLLDPVTAPALDLAACYAQRWEAETGYRELKVTLRGPGRVLRSRDPGGVTQEIWALLCACQIVHAARARAAATAGLDPDQVSFTVTLHATRRAATTTRRAPATAEILSRLLPRRRPRACPRAIHASTATRRATRTARAGPSPPPSPSRPPPSPALKYAALRIQRQHRYDDVAARASRGPGVPRPGRPAARASRGQGVPAARASRGRAPATRRARDAAGAPRRGEPGRQEAGGRGAEPPAGS